jgi:predicted RNase H-like HicB family nuclease
LVDATDMLPSTPPAVRYRAELDRTADHRFVATCAEMPNISAAALSVEAAVAELYAAVARAAAGLDAPPVPLCEREGRLGAWLGELELIHEARAARAAGDDDVQKPVPSALRAIAQWTAYRYRIVLEPQADGTVVANSPELPELLGFGETAGAAAADLQRRLADRAYEMLDAGEMPPEPLQDVEGRERAAQAARVTRAKVA